VFAAPLCTDDGVVVAAFFGVFVTFLVYLLLGASEPAELWSGIGVIGAGEDEDDGVERRCPGDGWGRGDEERAGNGKG
jgi:hypothetical protein